MKEFWKLLKKRRGVLISTLAILLICGVVTVAASERGGALFTSGQITNWGLSFQESGKPPVANASSDYLAQYDALYCRDAGEKKLYLTFDAGFENGNTEPILDALQKHHVKAVFFLVGNYLETQPELVKRMAAEGHTVGNHTYSHPDMSAILDEASFQNELLKNADLYREITGREMPKLYRPPQGKYCESNLKMAQKLGYHTVFWSLAYVDWYENDQPTKAEAFEKLLPRVHPGAVVLLHSTSKTNGEILDELLTEWENDGYTFGDLAFELLGTTSQGEGNSFEWQEIHS
ncbi:MAG: polysaccharide deacetylase family protein [Acutalibacter sp.]|nr:polysaccharide deacetylase family protein [Acutalibacter sp.]